MESEFDMRPGENEEEMVHGIPARLFDGYDGDGNAPPESFIRQLMDGAPPEIRARAEEFAKERGRAGRADPAAETR